MRVTIHQPQFLPWLGYLDKIDQADLFIALDSVQFKKNEWQNRNRIRTADGCQWVTVPVLHHFGQLVKDVRINQAVAWRSQHLRAIEMHYARAPFRDRYLPELRSVYKESWERLHELNMAVIRWLRLKPCYWMLEPMTEFVDWTREEIDYRNEARYSERLRGCAEGNPIQYVPKVYTEYTTRRLLVVLFCPPERADAHLSGALEHLASMLTRHCMAHVAGVRVLQ